MHLLVSNFENNVPMKVVFKKYLGEWKEPGQITKDVYLRTIEINGKWYNTYPIIPRSTSPLLPNNNIINVNHINNLNNNANYVPVNGLQSNNNNMVNITNNINNGLQINNCKVYAQNISVNTNINNKPTMSKLKFFKNMSNLKIAKKKK